MSGKRYFKNGNRKGEVAEWKTDLADRHRQKDCLKKVIAAMTIGKDVSSVFAEVTSCSQTGDLELKKLVYLYLINYAKTQPELAIMAVNTFVKDASDSNPMLRALAIRTMGCIRVDRITEYLCDPLERSLKDSDPYVRKTAAICVAKLYDMAPELVKERGFLDTLKGLVEDSNPMVVSNAVASLAEIHDMSGSEQLVLNKARTSWLLNVMEQCTEWGQRFIDSSQRAGRAYHSDIVKVYLLECLAARTVEEGDEGSGEDAAVLITRVLSRLQHANSAVVLAAVKVILKHLDYVPTEEHREEFLRKMAAPLVTLLSQKPETQFVALRNINLILQKYPEILKNEARVFYCKYNDPIYIKLEKLEIMVMLASEENIASVLAELKEYAQEIDVDFVRKSVNCIGQVAIRLEAAAQRCVEALRELVALKVSYVVQEAVVVIKDIFRCYPNRFEAVISDICAALDSLEEPDAKAAMVWIIGEYADRIDNSEELLSFLLDNFLEEPAQVQLQLLTATVKVFLKKADVAEAQTMISTVLTAATQQTDNPDLRDRAYMYWRLLSSMPEEAAEIVLAEKPAIHGTSMRLSADVRDELLAQLSTLASVYHKLPHTFVKKQRAAVQRAADLEAKRLEDEAADGGTGGDETFSGDLPGSGPGDSAADSGPPPSAPVDLLGGLDESPVRAYPLASAVTTAAAHLPQKLRAQAAPAAGDLLSDFDQVRVSDAGASASVDPFGLGALDGGAAQPPSSSSEMPLLVDAAQGFGCEVRGCVEVLSDGTYAYRISLRNGGAGTMSTFQVNFNRNRLGLGVAAGDTALPIGPLRPGQAGQAQKALHMLPGKVANDQGDALQVALKWDELTAAPFLMLQDTLPSTAPVSGGSVDDVTGGLL